MIYQWKEGSRHKTDPNVAGKMCADLESKNALTAKNLVDVNRPADAPLHDEFNWNDAEAAELYREGQARCIIRSLTTIVSDTTEKPALVRAFFNLEVSAQEYESVETIVKAPDKYQQLLKTAISELNSFQRKYRQLDALKEVFQAIENLNATES